LTTRFCSKSCSSPHREFDLHQAPARRGRDPLE
jgi:hypothetical protein